jgi:hypothetical protein
LKPYNDYYRERKVKDGYRASCKECCKPLQQKHYQENKAKYKKAYDDFINKNPIYQKEYYLHSKINLK